MTHASLFSGIGGPEVAAAMLGWENLFHCEINPFGRKVLDYWFPDSISYEDITKTSFKEWRGKVDVITGGFPCQPFSYAGKRGGREDDRYLWPEMLRAIDEIRPAWVVGENVAGITTMVEGGVLTDLGGGSTLFDADNEFHGYEFEQSFTIERICKDLERLGYSVQPVLVPAAAVGAPHRRDRIFICAHRDGYNLNGRLPQREVPGEEEPESAGYGTRLQHGERYDLRGDAADTEVGLCDGRVAGSTGNHKQPECEPGNNRGKTAADAHGKGREESVQPGRGADSEEDGAGVDDRAERFGRDGCFAGPELLPENRWRNFPTVSPIHRGNDGLPFDVDGLAIPFSKWRTESLKAYGNAIVPQVMYRIFEAIEKVSSTPNTTKK